MRGGNGASGEYVSNGETSGASKGALWLPPRGVVGWGGVAGVTAQGKLPIQRARPRVMPPCPHGRQRSLCKDCGGKGVCEHGRVRRICKECGGAGICEHGRQRYYCKDCGGKGICEHGRQRSQCKPCGGKGICEHGRQRSACKDCGGSDICEHGRQRSTCKECGGGSICEHGRRRSTCKECGGSDHVVILEATEVEPCFEEEEEEEPGAGLARVQAHAVAGPRGGKRKR